MGRKQIRVAALLLSFVVAAVWVAWSVVYPIPDIHIGITEQGVEAVLGTPGVRTHDEGTHRALMKKKRNI